jgi:NADH:ubiquinone oxidoreductase subunit 3 (subunit A)
MDTILLAPPLAFLFYLALALLLKGLGRLLAGRDAPSEAKSSLYAGGENLPPLSGAPGYRPFFIIALFFAILHLGVLMLGSSSLNWTSGVYLAGLLLALIALILG